MKCELCKESVYDSRELVGRYKVYLCLKHVNEWHEYITKHEKFVEYNNLVNALHFHDISRGKFTNIGGYLNIAKEELIVQAELFTIGKEWIENQKPIDEELKNQEQTFAIINDKKVTKKEYLDLMKRLEL